MILYTRWLLIPLGLFTVALSASVVAAEPDRSAGRPSRWLMAGALTTVLAFLLFQSRSAVYGIRYLAAVDTRAARYQAKPGYDVGTWLEGHVRPGQRVAFGGWSGYGYFASPAQLLTSESTAELQRLWEQHGRLSPSPWTADWWRYYAGNGFTYVIVRRPLLDEALQAWPSDLSGHGPRLVFVGRDDAVLSIERPAN
jgi:hypothetical protein